MCWALRCTPFFWSLTSPGGGPTICTMYACQFRSHPKAGILSHAYNHSKKFSASLERDENYVPRTRSDLNLPKATSQTRADYHAIFEETPIYTLGKLIFMTILGFQVYMVYGLPLFSRCCLTDHLRSFNTMGSPAYPPGTNVCIVLECALGMDAELYAALEPLVPVIQKGSLYAVSLPCRLPELNEL